MDKNMIHIDDLVKKRLVGGEEAELPGSWLRMRELLDKELPEKRAAGYYNWRRMFGVVSGLVLLSVLTVGGYHVINSTRFNNGHEDAVAALAKKPAGNTIARPAGSEKTALPAASTAVGTTAPGTAGVVTPGERKASRKAIAGNGELKSASGSGSTLSKQPSVAKVRRAEGTAAEAAMQQRLTPVAIEPARANALKTAEASQTSVAANAGNTGISADQPNNQLNTPANNTPLLASGAKVQETEKTPLQPMPDLASSVAPAADNTRLKTPAPQPDRPKDTLNKMTIVQRYSINPLTRTGRMTLDTVAVERLAFERAIQTTGSNTAGQQTVEETAPNPAPAAALASNIKAEAGAAEVMVPLSNYKVQSRRTNAWNSRSFDEVMRDVKFNLAQVKFYPGLSAGANSYMFGPNNLSGFQLGLFGLFTFGEAWGAMGELKYVHRFNGGGTLNDNYFDVKGNSGSYLQRKVEHFFKFSALQSIEMPLALRFAAGRLNVFGGVNMAYHFRVNAEEVSVPAASNYTPTTDPAFDNSKPTIGYDDFKSRFALGGLAGLSYEFSPSIQFDFRATKNFWDNASGIGASKVSQELYRAPSFQISIFYRFNQRNQIPKAK